jgi:hypothetical protein
MKYETIRKEIIEEITLNRGRIINDDNEFVLGEMSPLRHQVFIVLTRTVEQKNIKMRFEYDDSTFCCNDYMCWIDIEGEPTEEVFFGHDELQEELRHRLKVLLGEHPLWDKFEI